MKCKQCKQYESLMAYVYGALFSSTEPWIVEARNIIKKVLDGVKK